MGESGEVATEDTSGSETSAREETSLIWWIAVEGNRAAVAGVFLVITFLLLYIFTFLLGPLEQEGTSPLFYLYSALVGGNFTLVTIVISVSQLVISRQLGTPGQIQDQIQSTNEFRSTIEEDSDVAVAPVTPTEFLHFLLRSAAEATQLPSEAAEDRTGEAWEELDDSIDQLSRHIGRVEGKISNADISLVSALAVTLGTNYSADIYDLRLIRSRYADTYPDAVLDCLDSLIHSLQRIDVGRQYLKTLYMQDELSKLSRTLFYVGIPALFSSVLMLRIFAVGFDNLTAGMLSVMVPLTITVSLAPLLLLFAYVFRLTTVSRRTLAITPFTMAEMEHDRDILDLD